MKYFRFEQWSISTTAQQKGIDNSVPKDLQSHVEELVNKILDPLREAWGSDIIISSGYRCYALNKAIGGSNSSAHSYAYAVDLIPANGNIHEFSLFVMRWLHDNNIQFDQFIEEHKPNSHWVHIAIRNGNKQQRKQYLLYKSWVEKSQQYTSIDPVLYQGFSNSNNQNETTQVKNTLSGKSTYYNVINIEAIKSNAVYAKDENGEPITNSNGTFIPDDSYLIGSSENESDELQDITDIPAEPLELNLDSIELDEIEQVKGISFNEDGSYAVSHSKSLQEIMVMVQQWWDIVQRIKNMDFKNLINQSQIQAQYEQQQDNEETLTINAMYYMKAAFDMYGHAYRSGMVCPICGKKAKYLPPGGYCSPECMLKAVKDKSLAFLMAPNKKYKWLQDLINELVALLNQTNIMINAVVMIPDIIKELAAIPDEYKQFIENKIAEGFAELQESIQKAMTYKNELLGKILKPMNFGIVAKPVAMAMSAIQVIQESLVIAQDAFQLAFDAVKTVIDKLSMLPTGLSLPAESFAWALTPRSFMSAMPYTSPDATKIFINLPGGSGVPINGIKPLCPSALQSINFQAIDTIIQNMFPPLTPADYYLPPELFEVRFLFSDQSDLVTQLRQQLEDYLKAGPDYIPNFENLLPIKSYTFTNQNTNEKYEVPLPNIGYLWFLLGLMDAWAPHSQALVGSILNPLL